MENIYKISMFFFGNLVEIPSQAAEKVTKMRL